MGVSERLKVGLNAITELFHGDIKYIEDLRSPHNSRVSLLEQSKNYTSSGDRLGTLRASPNSRFPLGYATTKEFEQLEWERGETPCAAFDELRLSELNPSQLRTLYNYHDQRLKDFPDLKKPNNYPVALATTALPVLLLSGIMLPGFLKAYNEAHNIAADPYFAEKDFEKGVLQQCWARESDAVSVQLKDVVGNARELVQGARDIKALPTQDEFKKNVNECYRESSPNKAFAQHKKDVDAAVGELGTISAIAIVVTLSLMAKAFHGARQRYTYNLKYLELDTLKRNWRNLEDELETRGATLDR